MLASAAVLALAAAFLLRRTEPDRPDPVYQGRPASVWVADFIQTEGWEAQQALRNLGEASVPYLIPRLRTRDSPLNRVGVWMWARLPDFLKSRIPAPVLARDVRMRAVIAFREMGPPAHAAVPALIERLSDRDGSIRLHSAIALGNIGPASGPAVPFLKPFLKERHTVRVYVANALWKIHHEVEEVLPVLEAGVREEGAPFRWAAAVFLGELGAAAWPAIPALELAATAGDVETASCAIQALAQLGTETVPALIARLGDPDPTLRISAAIALESLGSAAQPAIPALKGLLSDHGSGRPIVMGRGNEKEEVCVAAARALSRIQSAAGRIE